MGVLLIFIDGFGLGLPDPAVNPFLVADTPFFDELLSGEKLTNMVQGDKGEAVIVATDACLGVSGIPQSATGQTSLFTGKNAQAILGYHLNGVPSPPLQELINEYSIFKQLKDKGRKVTFANMFTQQYFTQVRKGRFGHSATTLASLAAGIPLRMEEQFIHGEAVYHDITNETLHARGIQLPGITPKQAGYQLARIAHQYDFTLFEYFQTDRAGHSKKMEWAVKVLETLDEFLEAIILNLDLTHNLVIITSDHGNIEDLSTGNHTVNKVPTIFIGQGNRKWANYVKDITDITPLILEILCGG